MVRAHAQPHLMVWLKDALRIWLLSLEKLRQVTPLLWACSNLRRHKPLCIVHTLPRTHRVHYKQSYTKNLNSDGDSEEMSHLYFAILSSSCQQLCILAEAHAQHSLIHHHEAFLGLIL